MGWVGSQVNSFFLRLKKLRFGWGIFGLGQQILTILPCLILGSLVLLWDLNASGLTDLILKEHFG